ncbi:pyruvate decarboxylase [Hortaea werneckii]|nr:pyruvate decarboxylase [Hortaea werneckii]KAI7323943.1 pyruvate decarboxylase [Hortaea werneckii]
MSPDVHVAEYLFRRLAQLGIKAVHGVPGDFNLTLLDYVEPANLLWVGNSNELNSGYAADGYARIKGVGALITTFGVGELSAINAIAGAYAERVPVIHIVGVPSRSAQDSRARVHHTFNDGDFGRFAEMHKHVTVAQTKLLDSRTIPEQIDWTLQECLLHSRPVYVEIPVDVVHALVPSIRLSTLIAVPEQPVSPPESLVVTILSKIHGAKQPLILVDGEIRAAKIVEEVKALVALLKWPTWTTGFSKGLIDETEPYVFGIMTGRFGSQETQNFISSADLVLCFGPHFSSTNTFLFSSVPDPGKTILFSDSYTVCSGETHRDISARQLIQCITKRVDVSRIRKFETYAPIRKGHQIPSNDTSDNEALVQSQFWPALSRFFQPGDIILGETGTAGYGVRDVLLPANVKMFTPVTWLSIGYMLPAAQGAALAQRELLASDESQGCSTGRTILLIGDGSFQMTAQELSTIVRHNLNVAVFIINNDGYTIERCIHGAKAAYNDIHPWRYLYAPLLFGADEKSYTAKVRTRDELDHVLQDEQLSRGCGLRMVEVLLDREDAPEGPLIEFLKTQRCREE